ncbi:MAG: hypothetical protein COW30_12790 [Rhodospirillales bacterium CG15_BIG_FIL_POST_REV_8_21_14_020_66_15]|nr:MAG: hypothetical protein COW30_12790 [Rhodospirillales bacterium CG15_BIG_FIL_POST_REV_8_21_14_020_66_15]
MTPVGRRNVLAAGTGLAALLGAGPGTAAAAGRPPMGPTVSARDFGAAGDGVTDDTEALQRAFDAALRGVDAEFVVIPPGSYLVTRPIRVTTRGRPEGNVTRRAGISANGARIVSHITDGRPVIEIDCRATLRFVLIEGLEIKGRGMEGHGIVVRCERRGTYFYNFCLRDLVVEGCGGDGCRMIGNVFEGQIFNSYFRENKRNGATFGHGPNDTVFSAVHVFGCVFGDNGEHGVALIDGAVDVSFHGCYFLLNQRFGMTAETGCVLLSHCGFENNHMKAKRFEDGDAGLRLMVGGTLIGCTSYSIYNQTHLVRSYLTGSLTMIGCTGEGGARARRAGLAVVDGKSGSETNVIGCRGRVEMPRDREIPGIGSSIRFGGRWDSSNLPWIGDHCLWVDRDGRLRFKRGRPEYDRDGRIVVMQE